MSVRHHLFDTPLKLLKREIHPNPFLQQIPFQPSFMSLFVRERAGNPRVFLGSWMSTEGQGQCPAQSLIMYHHDHPVPQPQLTFVSTYIRVCSKGMMTCRSSSLSAWKTGDYGTFIVLGAEGTSLHPSRTQFGGWEEASTMPKRREKGHSLP